MVEIKIVTCHPLSRTHCTSYSVRTMEEHESSKEAAKTVGFQFDDKLGSLKGEVYRCYAHRCIDSH